MVDELRRQSRTGGAQMNHRAHGRITVAATVCLIVASCGGQAQRKADNPAPMRAGAVERHVVEGYPIKRDLVSLLNWPGLDAAVILTGVQLGKPIELADGVMPGMPLIVTPITARVERSLLGSAEVGRVIRFTVAGGQVGQQLVEASEELAPKLGALTRADRILVAGRMRSTLELGVVLDPLFVYAIDSSGTASSLLVSGGADVRPSFTIKALQRGITRRSERGTSTKQPESAR